ncbi:hypothetical protein [Streptomyces gilvosporeus]|nr:hypothetical protein [Streptomyces gilvosporeus]
MSDHMPFGGMPATPLPTRSTPGNGDGDSDPNAWIAPLASTAITAITGFFAVIVGMMSPMVCDSCSSAEADRFGTLFLAYFCGLLVPVALLLASWILPWRRKYAVIRIVLAALAPCSVVALVVLYYMLINSVKG